jgi:hypothetical protein
VCARAGTHARCTDDVMVDGCHSRLATNTAACYQHFHFLRAFHGGRWCAYARVDLRACIRGLPILSDCLFAARSIVLPASVDECLIKTNFCCKTMPLYGANACGSQVAISKLEYSLYKQT